MNEPTDLQPKTETTRPSVYSEIHNHSFEQLARKARETAPEEPKKEEIAVVDKLEEKAKEKKEERVERKREELTKEIAQSVKETLDEEKKASREAKLKEKEEKLKKEELESKKNYQPKWKTDPTYPKDEKGNPIPKSYDEIYEEAAHAAQLRMEAKLDEERAERDLKDSQKLKEESDRKESIEKTNAQIGKQLEDEYNELVEEGKLPKIVDEKNPEDEGIKAKTKLFKVGMDYNQERITNGKLPISSIKLIYHERYKSEETPKDNQPPGADAPIAGSSSSNSAPPKEVSMPYKDLHNMSYRDIMNSILRKASGK